MITTTRKRLVKGRRQKILLRGGPFTGYSVHLHSPGTLTFTVNGERGRYNRAGEWEAVQ